MSDSGSFRNTKRQSKTPAEQVSAVFEKTFPRIEAVVEYIPSAIKGKGVYVLTTARSFSRKQLGKVGFSMSDACRLKQYDVLQWRVPPDVMEIAIPGAMQMSPETITQRVRKLPGHEYSRVHNMHSHEEGYVVMDAKYRLSRSTLLEKGADKEQIRINHLVLKKNIIVPEQQMHQVLGIQGSMTRG